MDAGKCATRYLRCCTQRYHSGVAAMDTAVVAPRRVSPGQLPSIGTDQPRQEDNVAWFKTYLRPDREAWRSGGDRVLERQGVLLPFASGRQRHSLPTMIRLCRVSASRPETRKDAVGHAMLFHVDVPRRSR